MAVAVIREFAIEDDDPTTTNDDQVQEALDNRDARTVGQLVHAAGFDEAAGVFRIVDVWQSHEDACVARAQERGVIVRTIPGRGWVRVSCGYWTREDDIELLSHAPAP